jgi:hypothetical protein
MTILSVSCQNKDSSGIVDSLLLNLIHQQKEYISYEWGYEESGDELTTILSQFEADIQKGNNLENTINDLNVMFSDYKINYENIEMGSIIDSLYEIMNVQDVSLDTKKYVCFRLLQYMSWRKKNVVFNHNWKIRLLNLDTVYVPNKREMSYLYMLFNPRGDTIRATDMNYGSALGDTKTIDVYVDGEPGEIIEKVVRLPMTNRISKEQIIYKDTVILKIIND